MERKLSDKERFIIQVAVNRSAENHFDRQKGWKRVKRCTNNGYIIRRRHSWLAICVSALCLLSGSGYLFIRHFAVYPPAISPSPEIYKADGIPVLTLENGEQIFLNPNQSPLIRPQTAANLQLDSIVQSIRYLPTETPGYDSTLSYHSLEIPNLGEYRLQLADGSRIWLNSESSLRYPVKFGLHRREIFLSGEPQARQCLAITGQRDRTQWRKIGCPIRHISNLCSVFLYSNRISPSLQPSFSA